MNKFEWKGFSHSGSQRVIMSVINNDCLETTLNGFPPRHSDRVRLSSLQAPYSGAWLTTAPIGQAFILNDVHFSLAVRLRLLCSFR